ncbi:MAG: hypothetical protein ACOCSE_06280, partial [Chitinivibrionales bacterium]
MDSRRSGTESLLRFITDQVVLSFAGLIALLLILSFDILSSASEYLYFSTEIGIILLSAGIYSAAFRGKKWDEPPEKQDSTPQPDWKRFSKELFFSFILLAAVLSGLWFYKGIIQDMEIREWLKLGSWFLYYIGIFSVSIVIIVRYVKFVNYKALVTADIIMVFFLCFYEMLLLAHGTG